MISEITLWSTPWGCLFRFVHNPERGEAYALATHDTGRAAFYRAPGVPTEPHDARAYNLAPWIDERIDGDRARDAWASVLAGERP